MKSCVLGKNTSKAEVLNISQNGVWMLASGAEYFLPFRDYPWFRNAMIGDVQNVKLLHGDLLRWPALDVDLSLDSLKNPEKYPLVYK